MNEAGLPLNGSPFAEKNNSSCKFQEARKRTKASVTPSIDRTSANNRIRILESTDCIQQNSVFRLELRIISKKLKHGEKGRVPCKEGLLYKKQTSDSLH